MENKNDNLRIKNNSYLGFHSKKMFEIVEHPLSKVLKLPKDYFVMKVKGNSMINSRIDTGSYVIVKKNTQAQAEDVVIAEINNKLVIKKYKIDNNGINLAPTNSEYDSIRINPNDEFKIWGKVEYVINSI